jgi:hypothetical protein
MIYQTFWGKVQAWFRMSCLENFAALCNDSIRVQPLMDRKSEQLSNMSHNALVGGIHIHIHDGYQFVAADRAGHDIQFGFRHA